MIITCNLSDNITSYRGKETKKFADKIKKITKSKYVIPTCNGTSALYIALKVAGIKENEEVILPCLSFVASANSIAWIGAIPHFVDINQYLLLDTNKLRLHLKQIIKNGINIITGRKITAIMPVHLFGKVCNMKELKQIAKEFKLKIIEDACQSLGAKYKNKHTGTFGMFGALSFNGNKIVTTGGGGAILTQNKNLAKKCQHLITTAKIKSKRQYHDQIAYNFGMPAINAAYGLQELKQLKNRIKNNKANFNQENMIGIPEDTTSNYWMQVFKSRVPKESRPLYTLLCDLPMYKECPKSDLNYARAIENKIKIMEFVKK